MNCPDCGNELIAVGGVPTVWHCIHCTTERSLRHVSKPEVRFIGDTLKEFRRL